MSEARAMRGGRADRNELAKGPNGRCLCRWCQLEVPPGRLTFCSDWCVEEWKLRSDPGHLRERKTLWDADHIVPVAEGGGECDLSNMRTLCLKCHRAHTAELRARLRTR